MSTPAFEQRILLLVALCIGLVGCGEKETTVAKKAREGILVINNSAEPSSLDPQEITGMLESRIAYSLFEGLVNFDPQDSTTIPGVAESWSSSADGKVWTFKLRNNARWSNGDPVVAADFLFSFQRILMPTFGAEYASMLHCVKGAKDFNTGKIKDFKEVGFKSPDPHTLIIELENPVPYFLQLVCHNSWLPVHPPTILKFGKIDEMHTPWTRPSNLVGNGAFKLDSWEVARQIVVKKNPYYWDAAQVSLNAVEFKAISDLFAEERAYQGGELHITGSVPPYKIVQLVADKAPHLRLDAFLSVSFIRINTVVKNNEAVQKALSDTRVRRALGMVINRQQIADRVLRSGESPAFYYTPTGTGGFTSPAQWKEDLAEAKKLMAEAGYPDGKNFPKLEYLFNTSETSLLAAQAYQEMWRQSLGIEVELKNLDWKVYLSSLHSGDYQLARSAWSGDYNDPNTFLEMFISGNELNQTGWSDSLYDDFIKSAAVEQNPAKRLELFGKAEARLIECAPIIPVVFNKNKFLIRPEVQGWYPTLLGEHPLKWVKLVPLEK
ncbi:MAG: peptide ABC transporter substrate-binding protein [Opitutia bacterium]|nr:peptide ABC transporter substrate-binding protein [Opitutales bacterium]PHX69188.1 MAG: peptide ABC transporter substrate-binding protein [Opitutae bacterium]